MTAALTPMQSWALVLTLMLIIALLAVIAHLWIQLQSAREAIGRLNSAEWWVR